LQGSPSAPQEQWRRVFPGATVTGGAWTHAPPQEENEKWMIWLNFFSPSLPCWL